MKTNRKRTAIYLTLTSAFVLGSTQALAQTGNTSDGTNTLISITGGDDNSAFGESSLKNDTSGSQNTAVGTDNLTR